MVTVEINGLQVSVEEGTTILEAAKFLGFPIPTLCHDDGLSPYGACRLCVVEIGEGPGARLVSSCTFPVQEGNPSFRNGLRAPLALVPPDTPRPTQHRMALFGQHTIPEDIIGSSRTSYRWGSIFQIQIAAVTS